MTPLERKENLIKKYKEQKNMSKCDSCNHKNVCQYRREITELEGRLPVTKPPFISTIVCSEHSGMNYHINPDYSLLQQMYGGTECNPNPKTMV
jgi:hypothetical protein